MENFGSYQKNNFQDYLKDPRKIMQVINNNKSTIITWFAFMLVAYAIFSFFSSGDFSFVLTLGSLIQMFGFLLLAFKTYNSRSVSGISKNSITCYMICLFSRLISILTKDGYLPYDSSGDFIYRLAEIIAFVSCTFVFYLMHDKYKQSYNWDMDNMKWYYFTGVTFVIALLFHPSLNNDFLADFTWTFALYLEAFSMLPQIYLFRKKGGEIERFTGTYVASSGISKSLHFFFWLFTYNELNEEEGSSLTPSLVGYYVIIFQLIQLSLIVDYLWYYLKSLKTGNPFQLPSSYYDV